MENTIDIICGYVRKDRDMLDRDVLAWNIEDGLEEALQKLFTENVADYFLKIFKGDKNPGFTVETLELEILRKKVQVLEENKTEIESFIKANEALKKELANKTDELESLKKELMKGSDVKGERFSLLEI